MQVGLQGPCWDPHPTAPPAWDHCQAEAGTLAFTWAPQQQHHQHRSFAAALFLFTPSAQTSDTSCVFRPVAGPQSPSWWEHTVLSAVLCHRTRHANSVLTQVLRMVLRAGVHVCDQLRWTFYTLLSGVF